MDEIYKRYRPSSFKQMIGQDEAVRTLQDFGRRNAVPHTILLTGPSGCGKTTIARILRMKLGCGDTDFMEMNTADFRGIDMVRDLRSRMGLAPIGGKCRVWLIDECHKLTSDAQDALLKMLEDTPPHCYFLLATTDPQKLKTTIKTRCTEIRVRLLTAIEITTLLRRVAADEAVQVSDDVVERIVDSAEGSARKALVLLNAVIGFTDEVDQLKAIAAADSKAAAIMIARLLMKPGAKWPELAKVLKEVEEDAEAIRRMVLGYAAAILLNGADNKRADLILEEFREDFFNTGKPGLVLACRRVLG